jgi:hypothetical protein
VVVVEAWQILQVLNRFDALLLAQPAHLHRQPFFHSCALAAGAAVNYNS